MVKARYIQLFILSSLTVLLRISQADALSKEYQIIDDYLNSKEQSDDVRHSMMWVEELLNQTGYQDSSCFKLPQTKLYRALDDLTKLYDKSLGSEQCSMETLTLLRKAKKSAEFFSDWRLYDQKQSRVANLARQIGAGIAAQCSDAKERALPVRLDSLDQTEMGVFNAHMKYYEQALEDGVRGYGAGNTPELCLRYVITKYLHSNPTVTLTARETIKRIAEDKLGASKVSRSKLDRFVSEYFVTPCNYYIQHTGDIIDPLLEYVSFREDQESEYGDREDFYKALGRFNWCRNLLVGHKKIFDKPRRFGITSSTR